MKDCPVDDEWLWEMDRNEEAEWPEADPARPLFLDTEE